MNFRRCLLALATCGIVAYTVRPQLEVKTHAKVVENTIEAKTKATVEEKSESKPEEEQVKERSNATLASGCAGHEAGQIEGWGCWCSPGGAKWDRALATLTEGSRAFVGSGLEECGCMGASRGASGGFKFAAWSARQNPTSQLGFPLDPRTRGTTWLEVDRDPCTTDNCNDFKPELEDFLRSHEDYSTKINNCVRCAQKRFANHPEKARLVRIQEGEVWYVNSAHKLLEFQELNKIVQDNVQVNDNRRILCAERLGTADMNRWVPKLGEWRPSTSVSTQCPGGWPCAEMLGAVRAVEVKLVDVTDEKACLEGNVQALERAMGSRNSFTHVCFINKKCKWMPGNDVKGGFLDGTSIRCSLVQ